MKNLFSRVKLAATLGSLLIFTQAVLAQGTAFTYQGQLGSNGVILNGNYDFQFSLYPNAAGTGSPLGPSPITQTAIGVTNGLFTTTLDFGAVFTGNDTWLAISVRSNNVGSYTALAPLQELTPAPYAIYAPNAGFASSANSVAATNITGVIPLAQLPAAVITNEAASLTLGSANEIAPLTVPPKLPASASGSVATGNAICVAVAGRYAYVLNSIGNSLQIIDVSIPSAPVSLGTVGAGGNPVSFAVAGRYAYVSSQITPELQVIDVSNPTQPAVVGSVNLGNGINGTAVAGRYVYLVSGSGLQVVDVSNPTSPAIAGSVSAGGNLIAAAVAGRYLYAANYSANSLQIIDVSNPASPVTAGSTGTSNKPVSIAVAGRYAYVVANANSLQIFDVNNPASPVNVASIGTGTSTAPTAVAVAGRYAYVTCSGASTLQIYDVSTPSAPVNVGSMTTASSPNCVAVAGRYAYVAAYFGSELQVFDLGGAYLQQLETGAIESGTLQTRDTVTVGNNLNVRGGLTVSGSARITGGLSVDNGTLAATNFSGNGAGLTSLNASQLTSGAVPSAALTSVPAASLTGTVPAAQLPSVVITNNNAANVTLSGTFSGNGAGLTSLNASQLTSGAVPSAALTSVPAGSLTGTVPAAQLGNAALLAGGNTFTGAQIVNGSVGIDTSAILENSFMINTNVYLDAHALYLRGDQGIDHNHGLGFFSSSTPNGAFAGINVNGPVLFGYAGGVLGTTESSQFAALQWNLSGVTVNGTFNNNSDRNAKQNFTPVAPAQILDKVAQLPVSEWSYKTDAATRHIGPMAQDFYAAFAVGTDEKHIAPIDEGGVALTAIKALNQKFNEKDAEIQALKQQNESLAQRLNELETTVKALQK